MTVEPETRLRADARRNRDQLIAAAKLVFLELGPDAPLEEIARRAGVGIGTLYRRFPDREALIGAVARENFAGVLDMARAAVAEEGTRWDALVRMLTHSRDLRLSVRLALLSPRSWQAVHADPQTSRFRAEMLEVLDELVRGAQEEGTLRPDVGTGDVVALVSMLLRKMPVTPDDLADTIMDRALVVILDGLRAEPGLPLPGRPMAVRDLERTWVPVERGCTHG